MAEQALAFMSGVGGMYHSSVPDKPMPGQQEGQEWMFFESMDKQRRKPGHFDDDTDGTDICQLRVSAGDKHKSLTEIRKIVPSAFTGSDYGKSTFTTDPPEVRVIDGTAWLGCISGALQAKMVELDKQCEANPKQLLYPEWGQFFVDFFMRYMRRLFMGDEGSAGSGGRRTRDGGVMDDSLMGGTHTVYVAFDGAAVDEAKSVTQSGRSASKKRYAPVPRFKPQGYQPWIPVETKEQRLAMIDQAKNEALQCVASMTTDEKKKLQAHITKLESQLSMEEMFMESVNISHLQEYNDVSSHRGMMNSWIIKRIVFSLACGWVTASDYIPNYGAVIICDHGLSLLDMATLYKTMGSDRLPEILSLQTKDPTIQDFLACSTPLCMFGSSYKISRHFYDDYSPSSKKGDPVLLKPSRKWVKMFLPPDAAPNCTTHKQRQQFVALKLQQLCNDGIEQAMSKSSFNRDGNQLCTTPLPLQANMPGEADYSTLFLVRMAHQHHLCQRIEMVNDDADVVFAAMFMMYHCYYADNYFMKKYHLPGPLMLYINMVKPGADPKKPTGKPDICDVIELITAIETWARSLPKQLLPGVSSKDIKAPIRTTHKELEDIFVGIINEAARGKSAERHMQNQWSSRSGVSGEITFNGHTMITGTKKSGKSGSSSSGSASGTGTKGKGTKGKNGATSASGNEGDGVVVAWTSETSGRKPGSSTVAAVTASVSATSVVVTSKKIAISSHSGYTETNMEMEAIDSQWNRIDRACESSQDIDDLLNELSQRPVHDTNAVNSLQTKREQKHGKHEEADDEEENSTNNNNNDNTSDKPTESDDVPLWLNLIGAALLCGNDISRNITQAQMIKFIAVFKEYPHARNILKKVTYRERPSSKKKPLHDEDDDGDDDYDEDGNNNPLLPSTTVMSRLEKALDFVYFVKAEVNSGAFPDHDKRSFFLSRQDYTSVIGLANICDYIEKNKFKGSADDADLQLVKNAMRRAREESGGSELPRLNTTDFYTIPNSISKFRANNKYMCACTYEDYHHLLNWKRSVDYNAQSYRRLQIDLEPTKDGYTWHRRKDGSMLLCYDFGWGDIAGEGNSLWQKNNNNK